MRGKWMCFAAVLVALVGCASDPPPSANSPFTRTEVAGLGDPEVVVANQANRAIKVTVEGPTSAVLEIPAGETRQTKLPPGAYRYRAEARGVEPFDGSETFNADGRYAWSFTITAKYPPPPEALRAQLEAALANGLGSFEGVRIGDSQASMPAGLVDEGDGWRVHPTGWGARYKDGKVVAMRMGQNFMNALDLYEEPDLLIRFGQPTERVKPDGVADGEILYYKSLGAGFLVKNGKYVLSILFL